MIYDEWLRMSKHCGFHLASNLDGNLCTHPKGDNFFEGCKFEKCPKANIIFNRAEKQLTLRHYFINK